MIDEYEDPWGAHQGVPKVQKWPILILGGAILRPFWELWDLLVGPSGVFILVYNFQLLPPHNISVRIVKICCQSELDGSEIEKIQDFGQFQLFLALQNPTVGPQGVPFVGPPGFFILDFQSLLLSLNQISVTITKFFHLSEMDGGKIRKIQDIGQYWPSLVLWGPRGVHQSPPPPLFGSLPCSPLKYFQNETNPRLLDQPVWELFRKQGELSKNEGSPPFLGGGGGPMTQ